MEAKRWLRSNDLLERLETTGGVYGANSLARDLREAIRRDREGGIEVEVGFDFELEVLRIESEVEAPPGSYVMYPRPQVGDPNGKEG